MRDPSDEQEEGDNKTTAYLWDSMDEEDREDTMDILKQSDEWVIWKSKGPKSSWLPPSLLHQERYSRGLLGIQDQRMVANRGHPGQKTKKDIRMLGKKKDKSTTGSTGCHHN